SRITKIHATYARLRHRIDALACDSKSIHQVNPPRVHDRGINPPSLRRALSAGFPENPNNLSLDVARHIRPIMIDVHEIVRVSGARRIQQEVEKSTARATIDPPRECPFTARELRRRLRARTRQGGEELRRHDDHDRRV